MEISLPGRSREIIETMYRIVNVTPQNHEDIVGQVRVEYVLEEPDVIGWVLVNDEDDALEFIEMQSEGAINPPDLSRFYPGYRPPMPKGLELWLHSVKCIDGLPRAAMVHMEDLSRSGWDTLWGTLFEITQDSGLTYRLMVAIAGRAEFKPECSE